MTPLPLDVLHVWFQPQSVGRCKDCRAAISWRVTRRRHKPIAFQPAPPVLHHFEDAETGDRVDVIDRSLRHARHCPGPKPGSRRARRRRKPKPITVKPPAPQRQLWRND